MAMIPFSFEGLTPEWVKKAEELGETEEKKTKALEKFKELMSEQKDINCRLDDVFLLRFIRLKKYDLQKALKLCRSYYNFKSKHQGVYNGIKPSDVRTVMEMNILSFAPYRLPRGPHIAIFRIGNFDWHKASIHELLAAILVMAEMLLDCHATQLFGGVILVDFKDFTLLHYLQFVNVSLLSFFVSIMQDCWPAKIDSIHLVNEPVFARAVMNILRPILKKKTTERLHLHGSNLESLHNCVPRQYLPEELGGTLGPINYKEFLSYFLDREQYIEMLDSYGMIDKKKSRKH